MIDLRLARLHLIPSIEVAIEDSDEIKAFNMSYKLSKMLQDRIAGHKEAINFASLWEGDEGLKEYIQNCIDSGWKETEIKQLVSYIESLEDRGDDR